MRRYQLSDQKLVFENSINEVLLKQIFRKQIVQMLNKLNYPLHFMLIISFIRYTGYIILNCNNSKKRG
jgi:hypothetical protein